MQARQALGSHGEKEPDAAVGEAEARDPAEDAEGNALEEELAREALLVGAHRGADGDFLLSAVGAYEKEVRHVGAGDQ